MDALKAGCPGYGEAIAIKRRMDGRAEAAPGVDLYAKTLTIPQFLDVDRLTASHWHGMLRLTLPLKESVKPRRIQIDGQPSTRSKWW